MMLSILNQMTVDSVVRRTAVNMVGLLCEHSKLIDASFPDLISSILQVVDTNLNHQSQNVYYRSLSTYVQTLYRTSSLRLFGSQIYCTALFVSKILHMYVYCN